MRKHEEMKSMTESKAIVKIITHVMIAAFLYLFMIMPRIFNRPKRAPHMGVLYAHRGLFDNNAAIPENSMKAFKRAVEAGYGIELDVQLTKDGVPVIFHDFSLERMCGISEKLENLTYEQLSRLTLLHTEEKIPTLKEFLDMVDGQVPLIIELKIEWTNLALCKTVQRLLDSYNGVYCIESFNPLALIWYRKNRNSIMRGQLSTNFRLDGNYKTPLYFFLTHLLTNFITSPDFVAYNCHFKNEPGRILCRKLFRNLSVAWTVRSQEEFESIKDDFDLFIFDSFIPNRL